MHTGTHKRFTRPIVEAMLARESASKPKGCGCTEGKRFRIGWTSPYRKNGTSARQVHSNRRCCFIFRRRREHSRGWDLLVRVGRQRVSRWIFYMAGEKELRHIQKSSCCRGFLHHPLRSWLHTSVHDSQLAKTAADCVNIQYMTMKMNMTMKFTINSRSFWWVRLPFFRRRQLYFWSGGLLSWHCFRGLFHTIPPLPQGP